LSFVFIFSNSSFLEKVFTFPNKIAFHALLSLKDYFLRIEFILFFKSATHQFIVFQGHYDDGDDEVLKNCF